MGTSTMKACPSVSNTLFHPTSLTNGDARHDIERLSSTVYAPHRTTERTADAPFMYCKPVAKRHANQLCRATATTLMISPVA